MTENKEDTSDDRMGYFTLIILKHDCNDYKSVINVFHKIQSVHWVAISICLSRKVNKFFATAH